MGDYVLLFRPKCCFFTLNPIAHEMTTILEIPLRNLSPSAIEDLQVQYPNATLRIEAESETFVRMDEAQFWSIIADFDWRTRNAEAILAPAVKRLSTFAAEDIFKFHDILHEKLFALDAEIYARQLGSNRYAPEENKHFSVDGFLYARCCVVANGQTFFEAVLANPEKMPKEFTFESLLYLPRKAWKLKTGQDNYAHLPATWAETFSNAAGWPGVKPLKDRIIGL